MPRVMMLGRLPLAGQYQPPPGRLLQAQPGLYGLRRGGLGVTMSEVCNDPATMFMQTAGGLFSGAASSGCQTTGGHQADAGWCAASTGVAAANTTMTAACQQARAAAVASGDPTEIESLNAQLEIERLRAQSAMNLQTSMASRPAPKPDYTPYIVGGVALAAIVGLALVMKKR